MTFQADSKNLDRLKIRLEAQVSGDVYFDQVTRGVYATDASLFQVMPQCVVVPSGEADVVAAIQAANECGLPITARGGGTSLSGQTFGPGMVLDVSKSMNRVLEVEPDAGWAWVQAGVIRDQLNQHLKHHQLHFAPDPATGSRATIGGMIGNNTCGTRSLIYGKTIDHVLECRVAMFDGTICHFQVREPEFWDLHTKHERAGEIREAEMLRGLHKIVAGNEAEILTRYPKVLRRVSGYNLDEFVAGAGYPGPIGPRGDRSGRRAWNLSNLIVGSEGTLGILLSAKIRLTPLPNATAVCVVHFDDVIDSLRAVDSILEFGPSTVELLDKTVMDEARINASTSHMAHFIQGEPEAVQVVEFSADSQTEATQAAENFAAIMQSRSLGSHWPVFIDASDISDVWETRKLGLGLISNVKGAVKGRDFIEDACVPTQHLAQYIKDVRALCNQHGIDRISLYGHASVGVVHVVPALDLHDVQAATTMQIIAEQAFAWVMQYGGSWSGEHGDGQLRGRFLPKMFGPEIFEAFRQVKLLFDPLGLLNPGKVIDTQSLAENLRYSSPGYEQKSALVQQLVLYKYADQGGFVAAVEQCNGVGACRKVNSGTMCPSYMALRDEQHSTRGRANALRLAMSGQLAADPVEALASDGIDEVLSLCLACKACKSECPNAVDMSKLKSEVLQLRQDRNGIPLAAKLLGRMPDAAAKLAGRSAKVVDLASMIPGGRIVLEKLTGIDRRRPLPSFATQTLQQLLHRQPVARGQRKRGPVVLFDDTYANYFEPHIGRSAIDLLEAAGFEVVLAQAGCCQRPRLSKGLVREAKSLGTKTFDKLDKFARRGWPIICLEPSCASALVDDLADLIDDQKMSRRVANQVTMIDEFLAEQETETTSDLDRVTLHAHCHQSALFSTASMKKSFAHGTTNGCTQLDAGCCGMAGSFGYEHYDLSKQIGESRLFPAVRAAVADQQTIVACGISCRHQIKDFCDVQAKHWVEVVRLK